jgi:hypothetical protein
MCRCVLMCRCVTVDPTKCASRFRSGYLTSLPSVGLAERRTSNRFAVSELAGAKLPLGPAKIESHEAALAAFRRAIDLMPLPPERVEIASQDGILPGYLISAGTKEPAPVVIFYSGSMS